MQDNPRVINTLSVIARAVFDNECADNSLDGVLTMGQESKFRALFLLIINSQSQNKNFDKLIIRGMIHYMRDQCKVPKEAPVEGEEVDLRPDPAHIKKIIVYTMQQILFHVKEMDSIGIFHTLSAKESESVSLQILSLIHYIYTKMIDMIREGEASDSSDDGKPAEDQPQDQQIEEENQEEG